MFSKKHILNKIAQIVLHIVFWSVVLLFFMYFFGFESEDSDYILTYSLFLMPITIATTYISIYKLIPDYLITKQYARFGVYTFYTLVISGYLIILSIFFGLIFLSSFEYKEMPPISRNIFFVMLAVYSIVIVVSAFKLLKLNLKHTEETKRLENKILETQLKLKEQELNYLKMQIHPHFLFNTLNTLYGFSLKKADETPEMILKLSNLLDYLLYQVDKPFVLLSEEINHINDYITLENMRFNNRLRVTFNYDNCLENTSISPMLLIPFVENSFKHGYLNNGILEITISLSSTKESIIFSIENTNSKKEITNKGIGLINIKKRLELLYKDHYSLDIVENNSTFKVNLDLKLK
jgi:sensor histidine kinase YesM